MSSRFKWVYDNLARYAELQILGNALPSEPEPLRTSDARRPANAVDIVAGFGELALGEVQKGPAQAKMSL